MKRGTRASKADALAVVVQAFNRFQTAPFRIDLAGSRYPALKVAEQLGWVWITNNTASVTMDGVRATADYRGEPA